MKVDDIVKLRRCEPYGTMKVKAIHPKGYKQRTFITVEVYYSSSVNETKWQFGLIKEFRKSDLQVVKGHPDE